ncbi:hypothetical protein J1N35_025069 [Gossypium stocksii]|uniref:RNase H type-1 domain-containing protein n=1 Tax=Gossypium stocksii TaxID=47602 RepID=A0A9D3V6S2_9ROSI|nr:hypothetical protein J1N35_025069 [Gossypium stocksii]
MDRGVDMQSGSVMADGIVRCYQGDRVFGYGCNIGVKLILEAELRAIVDGLETTWEKGIVVDLILGAKVVGSPRLALEFCNWITKDWQVKIQHVPRTVNMVANAYTQGRKVLPNRFLFFPITTLVVQDAMLRDKC